MSEWYQRRLDGLHAKLRKDDLIESHAEKLCDSVWKEISHIKDLARSHFALELLQERGVGKVILHEGMGRKREGLTPPSIDIALDKNRRQIIAKGSSRLPVHLKFDFRVDPDDHVYLSHGGKPVTCAEAAELILDPLLFPEVPSPFHDQKS